MKSEFLYVAATVLLLSGCETTQPPPFDAAKSAENRREYNGIKGLIQKQKDQNYLLSAELQKQCDAARIDLAVAKATGDSDAAAAQQNIIDNTCV
ncbi:MAG: hypothetical protein HWE26_15970 [Alteromonadaceae bacterium]|nr:hypothetical protein [Alteromonadaceae bacterium]